ncbi:MAG: hypothetical protein D6689_01435 [Deltaproteobacteria bacterium]|nr:MAG: hypothetical protein D6689_01435 [Deltaproteobacteria bacterium]
MAGRCRPGVGAGRDNDAVPAPAARRRRDLGQWFTPPAVVDLALALAGAGPGARVLDPACGDGAFLAGARRAGASQVVGIELDPAHAAVARARVPGARVIAGDLFARPPAPFDVVAGNPPYVRAERLPAAARARVRARLAADWPDAPAAALDRVVRRGDLAAACVMRALRFARPDGGRVALVVSSALVDADYGDTLWAFVRRHAAVRAVVDAPRERWFADAAVNAVIVVLERGARDSRSTALARLRVPTARAAVPLGSLATVADVRAGDDPRAWRALLTAPDAWFAFTAAAGDRLIALGEVADVRRGATTGANDVFYLPRARAAALGIEPEALVPLLKRPADRIDVDPRATPLVAVAVDPARAARLPGARRYLASRREVATRRTLRARDPWWALRVQRARLFFTKAYHDRFVQHRCAEPIACDQRVYAVRPKPGVPAARLAAVLNSTWTALAIESLGRASMGEGALEWTVAGAAALPVVDPRRISPAAATALERVARRPIGPIADEVRRADRAALDAAVFDHPDRAAWWTQLADAVARRVGRPRAPAPRHDRAGRPR